MPSTHMVHLTQAGNEFAARVMVAKLGSAGILAEVRGVSTAYPILGTPEVFVEASEYAEARELITADLDDAFEIREATYWADEPEARHTAHRMLRPVLVATALFLLGSFALDHCGQAPVVHPLSSGKPTGCTGAVVC